MHARRDSTIKNDSGNRADAGGGPNSGRLEFSRVDTRHFEKPMAFDSAPEGSRLSSGQAGVKPVAATRYTDSDNRLFDALMSFDQNRAASPPVSPQTTVRSFVHYTQQDLKQLQRLMPGEATADDLQATEREARLSGRDANAGHIKIIDFDKQHAKDKENRRRGRVDMKIRYFD